MARASIVEAAEKDVLMQESEPQVANELTYLRPFTSRPLMSATTVHRGTAEAGFPRKL